MKVEEFQRIEFRNGQTGTVTLVLGDYEAYCVDIGRIEGEFDNITVEAEEVTAVLSPPIEDHST